MSGLLQLSDVATKIPDSDAVLYKEQVAELLGRKTLGFVGAQPVSFAKQHIGALQQADYYLCEKTDGIRCLLYLTFMIIDGEQREACFLIDRKNHYYYIDNAHLHFPPPNGPIQAFHTGTLLDGELVLDVYPNTPSIRRYLVFDCLAVDNRPLIDRTLDKRIGHFMEGVLKPYQKLLQQYPEEKDEQPFEVVVKKMEKAYGIEMMFKDVLPKLAHGNDGLVFTCRTSKYTVGTDQNIIKWKPPEENTVDFKLQLGRFPPLPGADPDDMTQWDYDAVPEMHLLATYHGGVSKKFGDLHLGEGEWELMKGMDQMFDARIIECYEDAQQRWRYKREKDGTPRFRDDKTDANFIDTVLSVLESIDDAVSERDLIESSGMIKKAWREREAGEIEKRKRAAQPA